MSDLEQRAEGTPQINTNFLHKVLKEKIEKRKLYSIFHTPQNFCRNCGSHHIVERHKTQLIERKPNPKTFSENAKPYQFIQEVHVSYFCKKCKSENIYLDVLTMEREEYIKSISNIISEAYSFDLTEINQNQKLA